MIEIISRSVAHAGGVHLPEGVSITGTPSDQGHRPIRKPRSSSIRVVGGLLRRAGAQVTRLGSAIEGPVAGCQGTKV